MSRNTPEEVLKSVVEGINTGDIESLMMLYEPEAAFVSEPGKCVYGLTGIREVLDDFLGMKATIELEVTNVTEADGIALVISDWSFTGSGPEGDLVRHSGKSADVLRRQSDGSWKFIIDNPLGTDNN